MFNEIAIKFPSFRAGNRLLSRTIRDGAQVLRFKTKTNSLTIKIRKYHKESSYIDDIIVQRSNKQLKLGGVIFYSRKWSTDR